MFKRRQHQQHYDDNNNNKNNDSNNDDNNGDNKFCKHLIMQLCQQLIGDQPLKHRIYCTNSVTNFVCGNKLWLHVVPNGGYSCKERHKHVFRSMNKL